MSAISFLHSTKENLNDLKVPWPANPIETYQRTDSFYNSCQIRIYKTLINLFWLQIRGVSITYLQKFFYIFIWWAADDKNNFWKELIQIILNNFSNSNYYLLWIMLLRSQTCIWRGRVPDYKKKFCRWFDRVPPHMNSTLLWTCQTQGDYRIPDPMVIKPGTHPSEVSSLHCF